MKTKTLAQVAYDALAKHRGEPDKRFDFASDKTKKDFGVVARAVANEVKRRKAR